MEYSPLEVIVQNLNEFYDLKDLMEMEDWLRTEGIDRFGAFDYLLEETRAVYSVTEGDYKPDWKDYQLEIKKRVGYNAI